MEARPSIVQTAPAFSAAGRQSIDQPNVSGSTPGMVTVIAPDHLPTTASTMRFTSGGGGGDAGGTTGFLWSANARADSIRTRQTATLILDMGLLSSAFPDRRDDEDSGSLHSRSGGIL